MEEQQNGHLPEASGMDEAGPSYGGNSSSTNVSPGTKGLYLQPFPGGQHSNPVDRYMRGSTHPSDYYVLTNVTAEEIAREERLQYFENIANAANGMLESVRMNGYNLRRSLNGQAAKDVVSMVIGQRIQQQRDFESRQSRMADKANGTSPLNAAGGV